MILPGFPVLLSKPASGSIVFPAVTVGRASIAGLYGYVRPGGPTSASIGGISGGTLSGTLVHGYVTDAVIDIGDGIQVYIIGNCVALLSDITALTDNGTPVLFDGPAMYDGGADITYLVSSSGPVWSSTGNRTVQLV